MDFEQLEQLVCVNAEGSISGAARTMGMSQPSLSRSMARLEAELGVPLFDRTRNSAILNNLGRLAVQHAKDALAVKERMQQALAAARTQLVLAGSNEAGLAFVREQALSRFPDTLFSQVPLAPGQAEAALREGRATIAVDDAPVVAPDMMLLPLPAPAEGAYLLCLASAPVRAREVFAWIEG